MTFVSTLKENRAMIFTVVGCIGVTVTAALAAWGKYKADEVAQEYKKDISDVKLSPGSPYAGGEVYCTAKGGVANELSLCERVLKTYKYYIPAVAVGGLTIASFLFGIRYSRIDSVKRFTPIPIPVKPKEQNKYDIKKEQITYDPRTQIVIIETGHGEDLFFDAWTGRYFRSSKEFLTQQIDYFNSQLDDGPGWACLANYYKLIDLPSEGIDCVNRYYFDTERGYLSFDFGFNYAKNGENCTSMLFEDGPFDPDTPELN